MFSNIARLRRWLPGLCLLACASVAHGGNCPLERLAEVPMFLTKGGQITVPVEVNGIHVRMALDTTSSLTNIYSGALAGLSLKPRNNVRPGVFYAGSKPLTQTVNIDSLKMAIIRWPQANAVVYPWNGQYPGLLAEDDVVGSLGQGALSGVDFELDFADRKLRLYPHKHCPGGVVYWTTAFDVLPLLKDQLGDTYIVMMANGKPMAANMASMSPISSLEEDVARKVLGLDHSTAGVDATGDGDGCSACGSITLKGQGLEIPNARVSMIRTITPGCHFSGPTLVGTPAQYDCGGAFPLHIGMNVLSRLHLYFATQEKKVYFTERDAGRPRVESTAAPTGAP